MHFETLIVKEVPRQLFITISRPQHQNSINSTMIRELGAALDLAEHLSDCRTVVLTGSPGLFCTGQDFQEVAASTGHESAARTDQVAAYMNLLKRFTLSSRVIISLLDGKVIAGGVGIVAASDIVLSTERTEFSLSEALWGLLPCCVIPFLIRRAGFQRAYFMTLTTRPIPAREAQVYQLIDEVTNNPDESLRKLSLRLNLLDESIIADLKRYFKAMTGITSEMESLAITESARLMGQPHVQQNILNYLTHGTFPWERKK
jgi:3-carboxymethyl-3-hydroxy-acyl-[acp] dehydratase